MRSLRALAWLRWRLLRNSLAGGRRRDSFEQFSRAVAVLVPIALAALSVGSIVGMGVLGFLGGRAIATGDFSDLRGLFVARLILLVWTGLVVIFAITSPTQSALARYTRLLLLPIERQVLHLVEVLSHLIDPWLVVILAGMGSFAIGFLTGGRVGVGVFAAALALLMLAVLATFGALVGFLATWLLRSRRRGELFTLLFVLGISLVGLVPAYFSTDLERREQEARRGGGTSSLIDELDRNLPRWSAILPSEIYGQVIRRSIAADWTGAGIGLAALAVEAGVLFTASSLVHRRLLNSLEGERGRRRRGDLEIAKMNAPFLTPASAAVAWATFRTALRSVRGRLAVILPGPMVATLSLVFRRLEQEERWLRAAGDYGYLVFGAAIVFCMLSAQPFAMNLFGSDRSGLTLQFLMPASDRELAWGKVAGLAGVLGLAVAISLAAALAVAPTGSPFLWAAVLAGGIAAFLVMSPISIWLSALLPVAADLSKSGSGGNPHPLAGLAGTLLAMVVMAPTALVTLAAEFWWQAPAVALLVTGIWLLVAAALAVPLMRLAARTLGARRENIALVAQGR